MWSWGLRRVQLNGGASRTVHTFRADVLSFLDIDPATGQRIINKTGGYPVAFPGGGGSVLGASLVVLYRSSGSGSEAERHRHVRRHVREAAVGDARRSGSKGSTIPRTCPDASPTLAEARRETWETRVTGPFATINNLFSASAGNAWDNVSRHDERRSREASGFFDTAIAPQSAGPRTSFNDCVAMGAMIYRTEVNDGDGDGLLDKLGDLRPIRSAIRRAMRSRRSGAMGALVDVKDVFIEIAAMRAAPETTYGSETAPMTSTLASVTDHRGHCTSHRRRS